MDSPQSEQGTYKAVPIDDAETATLSYISLDELQDPKDIKSPSLQARSVVEGKSPAKIQASVWHYAGHGVVDGMLTFGPVFFFGKATTALLPRRRRSSLLQLLLACVSI